MAANFAANDVPRRAARVKAVSLALALLFCAVFALAAPMQARAADPDLTVRGTDGAASSAGGADGAEANAREPGTAYGAVLVQGGNGGDGDDIAIAAGAGGGATLTQDAPDVVGCGSILVQSGTDGAPGPGNSGSGGFAMFYNLSGLRCPSITVTQNSAYSACIFSAATLFVEEDTTVTVNGGASVDITEIHVSPGATLTIDGGIVTGLNVYVANGGGVAYQNGGIYFGSVWDVPVLDSYTSDPGQLDAPGGDIALTVAGRGFSLPVTFELVIDGDPAPLETQTVPPTADGTSATAVFNVPENTTGATRLLIFTSTIPSSAPDFNYIQVLLIEQTALYPVSGVTLSPAELTMQVNEAQQLTAAVLPAKAPGQGVTWQSSDPAGLSITPNSLTAVVRALVPGTYTVTVTTNEGGFTATCAVTVAAPAPAPAPTPTSTVSNVPKTGDVSMPGMLFALCAAAASAGGAVLLRTRRGR